MHLLFISSEFPDAGNPDLGLDNVSMLNALADRWEIRAYVPRAVPLGARGVWQPRAADVAFHPEFVAAPRVPLLGALCNHRLCARALRKPLDLLRRDWQFDAVLCSGLFPEVCAVARLIDEFHFRFVTVAVGPQADEALKGSSHRKAVARHIRRAVGVVTSSSPLMALLTKIGFRKDRVTFSSNWGTAAEACHRLLLPIRH
jgi:hypothetical protein